MFRVEWRKAQVRKRRGLWWVKVPGLGPSRAYNDWETAYFLADRAMRLGLRAQREASR